MQIDLSSPAGVTLALLPEIVLTTWALGLLLVIGWRHADPDLHRRLGAWTVVGLAVTLGVVIWLWQRGLAPAGLPLMLQVAAFPFKCPWMDRERKSMR